VPFDEFTIQQLAGDLLPEPTLDQEVATGFHRCNMTTNEGGVIPEEYVVLYARDRTETTAQVWLGTTIGCAVCHDHKFDPITQREFYEFTAFFNNTTQNAMDGNIKDTPPIVVVPMEEDRETFEALPGQLAAARQAIEGRKQSARPEFDSWLAGPAAAALAEKVTTDGLVFQAPLSEAAGQALAVSVRGEPRPISLGADPTWEPGVTATQALKSQPGAVLSVADVGDFERDQAFTCSAWVKVPKEGLSGSIVARMDEANGFRGWDMWLDNGRPASHIVHAWPDDALKVVGRTPLKIGQWQYVTLSYDGSGKSMGLKIYVDGQPQETETAARGLHNTIRTETPFKFAQRSSGARINDLALQDVRIYDRALSPDEVAGMAAGTRTGWLVGKPADQRTTQEVDELFNGWLATVDTGYQQLTAKVSELEATVAAIKSRGTIAHVMNEKDEADARRRSRPVTGTARSTPAPARTAPSR